MIKSVFDYYFSLRSIISRMILLIMILLHDMVKSRTLHTFYDLFYWPDGICLDMIIVYVFLIGCLHIILMDIVQFSKILKDESK